MKNLLLKSRPLIHGVTGAVALCTLAACHVVSDQGPTGMNKIQKEQHEGKRNSDDYKIINVNKSNINHYNTAPKTRYGTIPSTQSSKLYNDAIRPYDKLTLLVIDTAEEGAFANSRGPTTFGPLEVPINGVISIPYAGEFNVLGKSTNTVEKEIKQKYSTIFNTAEVSLNRIERQPLKASVIGLVNSPDQHEINRKGVTSVELIAMSGGTKEEPFLCDYLIHRGGKTYTLNNAQITGKRILAQDGDVVEVKRSEEHAITMMGSVKRPGNHKFPKSHCHLSDFLGAGSGIIINQADATGVFIFRKVGSTTHVYRFNLQEPGGLINASKFNIHGKDIIYVTEAPLSKWGRVIRQILPFGQLQSFNNATSLGN